MSVTIAQQTIDWYGPSSDVELYIYASKAFVPADGVPVNSTSPYDQTRARPWRKAACTIDAEAHTCTIAAVTLPSTEDAAVNADTTLVAAFMDTSHDLPRLINGYSVFGGADVFRVPSDDTETTWAALAANMRGTAAPVESPLPVLLRDEFASGTANAGRSPRPVNASGSVWGPGAGAWSVSAGKLVAPASFADGDYQTIETGTANHTVSCVVTGYDNGVDNQQAMPGLIVRYVNANNYWLVQLDTYNNRLSLYERTAGVFTERAFAAPTLASGETYPLAVTASGGRIHVELGSPGLEPLTYASAQHQGATKVGVRVGGVGGSVAGRPRFEDLTVLPAFTHSPDNPLIERVAATWESDDVAAPCVFYDPQMAVYVMVYSGFDGTDWRSGLAYSSSPAGPFTKDPANPVFEPAVGEGYIAASAGVYCDEDGAWWMVYQIAPDATAGDPDGDWLICAAKSEDKGQTWTRLNGGDPILSVGVADSYDETGQHDPDVRLRDDGWVEAFFSGSDTDDHFVAGHAVGPDLEHLSASTPLAVQGRFGTGSDIGNVAVDGNDPLAYSVYFTHIPGGSRYVCRADTEDGGLTFNYYGGVLFANEAWASDQVFDPKPLRVGGRLYCYYSGSPNSGGAENLEAGIGVAWLDVP